MVNVIVRHKVEDFGKWKPVYDEHASARKEAGCQSDKVCQNGDDPNDVAVYFDWDSLENFKKFGDSDELKEAMQKAGVVGKPDFYYSD